MCAAGVVGLESGYYFSEVAGSIQVCATWRSPTTIECPFQPPFTVPISVTDNSAGKTPKPSCIPLSAYLFPHSFFLDVEEDYSILDPLSFCFEDCQLRSCIDVSIHNDNVLEEFVEVFTVSLGSVPGLSDRIMLSPAESRVVIIDDEGQLSYFLSKFILTANFFFYS